MTDFVTLDEGIRTAPPGRQRDDNMIPLHGTRPAVAVPTAPVDGNATETEKSAQEQGLSRIDRAIVRFFTLLRSRSPW